MLPDADIASSRIVGPSLAPSEHAALIPVPEGLQAKQDVDRERRGMRPDSGPLSLEKATIVLSPRPSSSRRRRIRKTCWSTELRTAYHAWSDP